MLRDFEIEDRERGRMDAYASIDRMTTLASLGIPATLNQIIPERTKSPARLDPPGNAPAESFGSESVDLAGILTEGEGT